LTPQYPTNLLDSKENFTHDIREFYQALYRRSDRSRRKTA
jgi:hypothetical protein